LFFIGILGLPQQTIRGCIKQAIIDKPKEIPQPTPAVFRINSSLEAN
jgi:hypothetical protein